MRAAFYSWLFNLNPDRSHGVDANADYSPRERADVIGSQGPCQFSAWCVWRVSVGLSVGRRQLGWQVLTTRPTLTRRHHPTAGQHSPTATHWRSPELTLGQWVMGHGSWVKWVGKSGWVTWITHLTHDPLTQWHVTYWPMTHWVNHFSRTISITFGIDLKTCNFYRGKFDDIYSS